VTALDPREEQADDVELVPVHVAGAALGERAAGAELGVVAELGLRSGEPQLDGRSQCYD
jgi:hypothetical protein